MIKPYNSKNRERKQFGYDFEGENMIKNIEIENKGVNEIKELRRGIELKTGEYLKEMMFVK